MLLTSPSSNSRWSWIYENPPSVWRFCTSECQLSVAERVFRNWTTSAKSAVGRCVANPIQTYCALRRPEESFPPNLRTWIWTRCSSIPLGEKLAGTRNYRSTAVHTCSVRSEPISFHSWSHVAASSREMFAYLRKGDSIVTCVTFRNQISCSLSQISVISAQWLPIICEINI